MNLSDIKTLLANEQDILAQYHIKSIGIFGSFVRGEQSPKSDIDILIEFDNDEMDLFTFIELKNYLSSRLGRKVDLVMKDTLKPYIGKRILDEVLIVFSQEMARRDGNQHAIAQPFSDRAVIRIFGDDRLENSDGRFSQATVNPLTQSGADDIPVIHCKHYAGDAEHGRKKIGNRQTGLNGRAIREAGDMR